MRFFANFKVKDYILLILNFGDVITLILEAEKIIYCLFLNKNQ